VMYESAGPGGVGMVVGIVVGAVVG
jgi:hypothetical protein